MSQRAIRHHTRDASRRQLYLRAQDTAFFADPGRRPMTRTEVFDAACGGAFAPARHVRRVYRFPRLRLGLKLVESWTHPSVPIGADCWFALDSGLMNLDLLNEMERRAWADDYYASDWQDYDSRWAQDWDQTYWDHHDTLEDDERHAVQDKADQMAAMWAQRDLERAVSAIAAFDAEVEHA